MPTPSEVVVRNQLRRRRVIRAKLNAHRIKVRWLGGHPPPRHWIDQMWALVEQQ